MKSVGKPDAGNPHVRFDERGRETGDWQSLKPPRPSSTLQPAKTRAETTLTDTIDRLARHLVKGAKVRIVGLGIFQVKRREARMGRNPRTGEAVKIKASKKVTFRAGKELKEAV